MEYTNYTEAELAHEVDSCQCDIEQAQSDIDAANQTLRLIGEERERRRNAKPAIGTIYKHRDCCRDKGVWVVTGHDGVAVELAYHSSGGKPAAVRWLPYQVKNTLIEQTLTTKES